MKRSILETAKHKFYFGTCTAMAKEMRVSTGDHSNGRATFPVDRSMFGCHIGCADQTSTALNGYASDMFKRNEKRPFWYGPSKMLT